MEIKKTIKVRYIRSLDKYVGVQFKGKYLEEMGFNDGDELELVITEGKIILTKVEKK